MMGDSLTASNGKIAILNAGAQYLKNIERSLTEQGAEVEVIPLDAPASTLSGYSGIVLSGGHRSVTEPDALRCDKEIFSLGIPVFGICYGMQDANEALGGKVGKLDVREYGEAKITLEERVGLFEGLEDDEQRVLMSHGDSILELAPGMKRVAYSTNMMTGEEIPAAVYHPEKRFYGTQFHPEVWLTENGRKMMKNFIGICGVRPERIEAGESYRDYQSEIEDALTYIRQTAGDKKVVIGMSGGKDSTVTRELLRKAGLPDEQVISLHFDTGMNRKGESAQVVRDLNGLGYRVELIDAGERLFESIGYAAKDAMNGIHLVRKGEQTPPLNRCVHSELKRAAFGWGYVAMFDQGIREKGLTVQDCKLAQGTLFTDAKESGDDEADTIKGHHNRVKALDKYEKLEPCINWLKDDIVIIGKILGIPDEFLMRQPFPGPGLSVRIVCITKDMIDKAPQDEVIRFQLLAEQANDIAKHFGMQAYLVPVRTVGVAGDGRDYSWTAILKPEKPWEEMTEGDWQKAKDVANTIPMYAYANHNGKTEGICRVLLSYRSDFGRDDLFITETYVTPETVGLLQEADHVVRQSTAQCPSLTPDLNLDDVVSQFPVALLPIAFGMSERRAVCLRPARTPDFFTLRPALPGEVLPFGFLKALVPQLVGRQGQGYSNGWRKGISNVLMDLSSKPKGTTEME